jgi:hypothetical protein
MGADKSAENTPNALKFFGPICSAQAQKFVIFEKKLSLGVRSLWLMVISYILTTYQVSTLAV